MRRKLAILIMGAAMAISCGAPGASAPPARTGDTAAPPAPAATSGAPGQVASAPAAAQQAPTAAALRKLRLALGFLGAEAMPVFVGLDQGLYRKYGVDVDSIVLQSSAQIAPSMASGEIDIGLSA